MHDFASSGCGVAVRRVCSASSKLLLFVADGGLRYFSHCQRYFMRATDFESVQCCGAEKLMLLGSSVC